MNRTRAASVVVIAAAAVIISNSNSGTSNQDIDCQICDSLSQVYTEQMQSETGRTMDVSIFGIGALIIMVPIVLIAVIRIMRDT